MKTKKLKEKVSRYQVSMPESIHEIALGCAERAGLCFSTYLRTLILKDAERERRDIQSNYVYAGPGKN